MGDQVNPALRVADLRKSFRTVKAVDGVSFDVGPGQLLGFIGPNGAGKSTTIKIITGQLLADAGAVHVGGHDITAEPLRARQLIGYVPQDMQLYPFLTGRELLLFVAEVRGLSLAAAGPEVDALLARFGLDAAQNRMTREYSEGMARKLAIAAALIGQPAVLLLDESLNGLDPRASAEVKAILTEELARGAAIVLVSHILEVLERLCTTVLLVDQGRVVERLDRARLDAMIEAGETLEGFFIAHTSPLAAS